MGKGGGGLRRGSYATHQIPKKLPAFGGKTERPLGRTKAVPRRPHKGGGDSGLSRSLSCVCQSPIAPRWG